MDKLDLLKGGSVDLTKDWVEFALVGFSDGLYNL
jgi:hypothetical protein